MSLFSLASPEKWLRAFFLLMSLQSKCVVAVRMRACGWFRSIPWWSRSFPKGRVPKTHKEPDLFLRPRHVEAQVPHVEDGRQDSEDLWDLRFREMNSATCEAIGPTGGG